MYRMHKTILNAILLTVAVSGYAVSPEMLKAVAMVESSNNPNAVGDSGKALGMYQLHKPAWEQVSQQRENAGLKTWSWSYALDKDISAIYASAYMNWLSDGLKKRIGRNPEHWEVYAAYNRGLGGFAKANYKFSSLPAHTQKACQKITSLTQNSNPKR